MRLFSLIRTLQTLKDSKRAFVSHQVLSTIGRWPNPANYRFHFFEAAAFPRA